MCASVCPWTDGRMYSYSTYNSRMVTASVSVWRDPCIPCFSCYISWLAGWIEVIYLVSGDRQETRCTSLRITRDSTVTHSLGLSHSESEGEVWGPGSAGRFLCLERSGIKAHSALLPSKVSFFSWLILKCRYKQPSWRNRMWCNVFTYLGEESFNVVAVYLFLLLWLLSCWCVIYLFMHILEEKTYLTRI